jgi:hypothetical protein
MQGKEGIDFFVIASIPQNRRCGNLLYNSIKGVPFSFERTSAKLGLKILSSSFSFL